MKLTDILNAPWAIVPSRKREINSIYEAHLRGEKIDIKGVEAAIGRPLNNQKAAYETVNGVAVLSVDGVIAKKMNLFTQISGGVYTQQLQAVFRQALDDRAVESIVLVLDSPGGEVDGTQDLAELIYSSRGTKPIVSLADGMMASAAYWIGSAGDRVYAANDTTIIGSIGVVASHVDVSGAEERYGYKTTEITAGKYKRIASQYAPLSQEGRQSIQDEVDYIYSVFLDAVAKYRGVASAEAVHEMMADGRIFFGQQALNVGLVDGVLGLDTIIESLVAGEFPTPLSTIGATLAVPSATDSSLPPNVAGVAHDADSHITENSQMAQSKDQILADSPEAAAQLRAEGETAGVAKGKTEGSVEGSTAERERIQGVLACSMPGHEALVQKLAFDGKTTPAEAALAVLTAEKGKNAQVGANLNADAPKPAPAAIEPNGARTEGRGAASDKDGGEAVPERAVKARNVTKAAQTYMAEQRAAGRKITASEAVNHILSQESQ